jgi:hypothetical protein
MRLETLPRLRIAGGLLAIGLLVTAGDAVNAADHIDSPGATADPAADITDFFAWADADTTVAIIAFAGLGEAGASATYDAGVVYGIHFDQDGDGVSDHDVWVRFGQNADGDWGVQATGLAGTDAVVGPVEEVIDAGLGQNVFAGLRDDPFFFDFEGFQDTLGRGTLSFENDRDFFEGTNVTAIAVEVSTDLVSGGGPFSVWASTRR